MAHENDWVADKIQGDPPWFRKTWNGLSSFDGRYIWTDGINVYYSSNTNSISKQYILNRQTSTWEPKDWGSRTPTYGDSVWTDGDDIYFSRGFDQYVFDKENSVWNEKNWTGLTSFYGYDVWNDGTDYYYSYHGSRGDIHYILNKETSTWTPKTWYGLTSFHGEYVWTDGENVYYSVGSDQYVLDKETSTWSPKTWNGLNIFAGSNIWTDNENIYYSLASGDRKDQYVLDKSTSTWVHKTWSGDSLGWGGGDIWFDGGHIYYSSGSYHSELKNITSVPYRLNFPELQESIDIHDKWVSDIIEDKPDTLVKQNWGGFSAIWGQQVWTDGENIYYLGGLNSYALNRSEKTWEPKTWYGLDSIRGPERTGSQIWTDGDNVYYSDYKKQFVLDKTTSTWNPKTWNGRSDFYGSNIWTDGENIYLSGGNANYQYTLDKATSTWIQKTWYGYQNIIAGNVWFDGDIMYYSAGSNQYVFDKSTSIWIQKTWYGFTSPQGSNIWSRNGTVYYSDGRNQFVLDKATSTWSAKTWEDVAMLYASGIWTDGEEMYYSYMNANNQYRITDLKITTVPYRLNFPELKESVDPHDEWLMYDDIPYRLNFPELIESIDIYNSWLISDDIPFRWNFPPLIPTNMPSDSWLQDKGWDPRRPWPDHRSIIQKVQTIPNIPDVDWTKSMQQTFEFYTVDPNNWYDDQKLENIISCDLTHDLTSDKRGNASITVTEPLPECYIRTYLVVTQAGYMHKICLGTYLYMTSSDSFDGMKHNITMTGYTPMVELEEKLPPLGFHIVGITNRKHSGDAPMVTDAIKDIVTTYTRCEIENRTVIQKPLLNDFVAGTNDNFLTVINNILNASSLQQYILTVDEWGTIIVKDKPVLEDAIPTYIYTDDNSSILLPSLDTNDDIYGIPNVVEVLYTGDKRLPAIRVIVKNEDPTSIVSIPARGREIAKRFTITNIAAPVNDYSEAAVRAQVTAQAERLLEAASTINKTISYSHGYCDVKVGDTVLINYERAGVTGIRAKVVSQRISCKPGCQVDEQAVYTKKLWNRGV